MNTDNNMNNSLNLLKLCESQIHSMSEEDLLKAHAITYNNQACVFKQLNLPKLAYINLLKTLHCEIK